MENIDLDHKLEYKGYWWLPSNPDNKVAGILSYYPNEQIQLELMGCFGDYSLKILQDRDQEELIYGTTSDSKDITLLNSFRSLKVNFHADFPIVRYTSDYMIIGKHVKGLDEKRNYWATVNIPELTYWCRPNVLKTTLSYDKNDMISGITVSFSTKHGSQEDVISRVKINETTSIAVKQGVRYYGDRLSPEIEQSTYLEIRKKKKASIWEFLKDIFIYEQFLSLATLSIVKCSGITLHDKYTYHMIGKIKLYEDIHIIHADTVRNNLSKTDLTSIGYLFNYNSIIDIYPLLLKNWYNESPEITPIRSHLISSLEKKRSYNSVDFLIVIQALEGFCRRFRSSRYRKGHSILDRDYKGLFAMMSSLQSEFSDVDIVKKCAINIDAVVDSRNYYSHFMPKSGNPNVLDSWDLYELTIRLRILLICCVLSLYGFDNGRINRMLNDCSSRLLDI